MSNSRYTDNNGPLASHETLTLRHGVCWSSIFAGAASAITVSMILFALGSGLGLAISSPWANMGASGTTIAVSAIVWLVLMQWLSAAFGGYFTGMLRGKRVGMPEDEIYLRDTAHGFLSWVVATIFTVFFLASSLSYFAGGGLAAGAGMRAKPQDANEGTSYYVDNLFRNDSANAREVNPDTRMETTRIMINGLRNNDVAAADREHLANLVAANTGISHDEAVKRVDDVIVTAKTNADKARKMAATMSIIICLAMLSSAFIASIFGICGGRSRDKY